jgi:hypothetical protein
MNQEKKDMKGWIVSLALVSAVTALPAKAEIADISLGENSIRAALAGPLAHIFPNAKGQYDTGVLIKPKTDNDLVQLHAGALIVGDAGAQGVDVAAGLGVRGIYVGRDSNSGGALSLGGQFEARMPSFNRVGISGHAYYAPSASSFGEVDEYREYAVAVDYQVVPDAAVYVGYRNINYDIHDASGLTAENGFRAGLRLTF